MLTISIIIILGLSLELCGISESLLDASKSYQLHLFRHFSLHFKNMTHPRSCMIENVLSLKYRHLI